MNINEYFGRMLIVGTQPYMAEPKLLMRFSVIYDHLAGQGVLSFPKWLYPRMNLKENQEN